MFFYKFLLIIRRYLVNRYFSILICQISKIAEIYNSNRDRFNDRSLYDQRILITLVALKWDNLVVSGRPPRGNLRYIPFSYNKIFYKWVVYKGVEFELYIRERASHRQAWTDNRFSEYLDKSRDSCGRHTKLHW